MPTIETDIFIAATPERVWGILTDLDSYPEWNPFIIEASGELREGSRPRLIMRPPGGRAMTFKPVVLRAAPGRELRWRGRLLMPGIFDGEHWFRIEPDGENGTRLEQGETFSGFLPRFMKGMLKRTETGFESLNVALRDRAETTPIPES